MPYAGIGIVVVAVVLFMLRRKKRSVHSRPTVPPSPPPEKRLLVLEKIDALLEEVDAPLREQLIRIQARVEKLHEAYMAIPEVMARLKGSMFNYYKFETPIEGRLAFRGTEAQFIDMLRQTGSDVLTYATQEREKLSPEAHRTHNEVVLKYQHLSALRERLHSAIYVESPALVDLIEARLHLSPFDSVKEDYAATFEKNIITVEAEVRDATV
jgi:hypothetical protein